VIDYLRDLVIQAGGPGEECHQCSGPVLEYIGDNQDGITRIDCGGCGARWQAMDTAERYRFYALQAAEALTKQSVDRARIWHARADSLIRAYGTIDPASRLFLLTRDGWKVDGEDDGPF